LAASESDPKNALLANLRRIADSDVSQIDLVTISEIERTPSEDIVQAIHDILSRIPENKTVEHVKQEEFSALREAADRGYPPRPSREPSFEVDRNDVFRWEHNSGLTFRITPVKRLRVVIAQRGYRRPVRGPTSEDGRPIRLVETYYSLGGERLYPGVALYGEGIFIDLPDQDLAVSENRGQLWVERQRNQVGTCDNFVNDPIFVWWHTLSHRIVNALSLDSGYSTASIRERVYFTHNLETDSRLGGVILYTSQQGSDGSLGGLMALCNQRDFGRVMTVAERNLNACSNDPLCSEHTGANNGAACYACLMISETSCEFHNTFLDRLLLAQTLIGV